MSDEELEAIAKGKKVATADLSKLSDADLEKIASRGGSLGLAGKIGDTVLGVASEIGRQYDRFTGAPVRAAIGAMQDGSSFTDAIGTGFKQFTKQPEEAPTGKEIAKKAGLSDVPFIKAPFRTLQGMASVSPAGLAGFGIDVAADPTNFIPANLIAKTAVKGTAKGVGTAAMMGIKGGAAVGDVLTGTRGLSKAVNAVADRAKATKLAMDSFFQPKIADDFAELASIAEKNKIPKELLTESVEFGPRSLVSRMARTQREGFLGEQSLQKFEKGVNAIRDAISDRIKDIGGGKELLTKEAAGSLIREGAQQNFKNFFDKFDGSYNKIIKEYPDMKISPEEFQELGGLLDEIEVFAKEAIDQNFATVDVKEAKELLRSVNSIKGVAGLGPTAKTRALEKQIVEAAKKGPIDPDELAKLQGAIDSELAQAGRFDKAVQIMRKVGNYAYPKANKLTDVTPDMQKMRQIYDSLRETLASSVEKNLGTEAALDLKNANFALSDMIQKKKVLDKVLGAPVGGENVFDALVLNGDTSQVQALREIMPKGDWKQIQAAFLNSLIKPKVDGEFGFRQFFNAMQGRKETMAYVLDPESLKDISDLVRLGDRFGYEFISSSGTSAGNMLSDLKKLPSLLISDGFLQGLKSKARGLSPREAPTGLRIPGTSSLNDGQGIRLPIIPRSKFEMRTGKIPAVISTQDFEVNQKRRDKERKK